MSNKKSEKRKKIRTVPVLILLIILILLYLIISNYLKTDLENIIIIGNDKLTDQEIIELLEIDDYPDFFFIDNNKLENKLLENPLVEEVSISKKFYHVLVIEILEYDYLFLDKTTNNVVVGDEGVIPINQEILSVPILLNYIPDSQYSRFVEEMDQVDAKIINKISEIQYLPNEYDPDRFLLYMTDGNSVYLTLTKFDVINKYNEVVPQLEGKKGILYLDSGNHFSIIE